MTVFRTILSLRFRDQKRQNLAHMKTTILPIKHSMNHSHSPFVSLFIPLVIACLTLAPQARATCQDGCDSATNNTFLGESALINNVGGVNNTAVGWGALLSNTF